MAKAKSKATEPRGSVAARTRRQRRGEPGRAVVQHPGANPNLARPRIAAKESLESAFTKMGGIEGLVRWGKKNPTEFYRIWARLLPRDVNLGVTESLEDLLSQLAEQRGGSDTVQGEFEEVGDGAS